MIISENIYLLLLWFDLRLETTRRELVSSGVEAATTSLLSKSDCEFGWAALLFREDFVLTRQWQTANKSEAVNRKATNIPMVK